MALKDLVVPHAKARDWKTIELIDRLEHHRAAIDFPTSDFKLNREVLSADLKRTIVLLLDYRDDYLKNTNEN